MKTQELTKRDKEVFMQLVEDGRMSDQEIARKIGTSRPTVARIRQKLEKKGFIRGYIARPNFEKLGLKVMSVIFYRWLNFSKKEELERVNDYISRMPEVTSLFKGEGLAGRTHVIVSTHTSLEDQQQFLDDLRQQWKDNVADVEVFLSSTSATGKRFDIQDVIKKELRR